MSSFVWLGLTGFLVVAVVLSHRTPKGGNPVAGTRLMKSARGILVLGLVLCSAMGVWSAFKH
jgi:hypothetical protein